MTDSNPKVSPEQLFRQYLRVRKAQSNVVGAQILLRELATLAGDITDVVYDAGKAYQVKTKPQSSGLFDVEVTYIMPEGQFHEQIANG